MAIELYYTLSSDKHPRKWHDPYVTCGGSLATWMCFMSYMEKKYLPPYKPGTIKEESYYSRFSASLGWNKSYGDMPMQEVWDLQLSSNITHAERLTMQSMMDRCFFHVIDFSCVSEAWLEVANEMNGKWTKDAFGSLINTIRELIHKTPGIHSIAVHWNSVVSFYECNGETDENCYDFVADNTEVESKFSNS